MRNRDNQISFVNMSLSKYTSRQVCFYLALTSTCVIMNIITCNKLMQPVNKNRTKNDQTKR